MEDLLASLLSRIFAYNERGDASAVLADQAVDEADRLCAGSDEMSNEVLRRVLPAVAWLHWCRYLAQPGQGHADRQTALELFGAIVRVDPEVVPEKARRALAVAGTRDDGPDAWYDEALALLGRARDTGERTALDRAIDLLRRSVQATSTHDDDWAVRLGNLSLALRTRFEWAGELADVNEAITAGRSVVEGTSINDLNRAGYLSILGNALQARSWRTGDVADLDAAITVLREALQVTPNDGADRAGNLSNLGAALATRYGRTGDSDDLDAAITTLHEAVGVASADHPDRAGYLSNLGMALRNRFERVGDRADLDAAIVALQEAVQVTPVDDPDRGGHLSNLGVALQRTGDRADLDAAIVALQEAVQVTPVDHPKRGACLANLGNTLRFRFEQIGDLADGDAAISALREAVKVTPLDHPGRGVCLSNLGIALRVRFEQVGDLGDVDAAILALREAVEITPIDDPSRARHLSSLGVVLQVRFEEIGELADLDAAIAFGRQAVENTSLDHLDRVRSLADLSNALCHRFERVGELADLDAAIAFGEQVVQAIPTDHHARAVHLTNLGRALEARFEQVGELADLDAAITLGRQAVEATPADYVERALYLSNLGSVLQARFRRVGELADLDAAINALREAVEATPIGSPARPTYLSNYGITLNDRFERVGNPADLDAAIATLQQAVEAIPADHPSRRIYLSNLGVALLDRFNRSGDLADLDAAITALRQAVQVTPADHRDRARYLSNLGLALRTRFVRFGEPADAQAALDAYRDAASVVTAPTSGRIDSSRYRGAMAASLGRWQEAADGHAAAVALLPLLAWRGVGRRSREQLLADVGGLAADAAACAIAAGEPDRAVELLEQGRGVLWSQLLETRTELTALRQAHPDLAARLDALRAELDRPANADTDGTASRADVDARMTAARQWDTLIDQVRTLPGFHDFARPPAAAQLRRAAAGGTVVVVNISQWRCDALLISDTTVRVKELSDLTQAAVVKHANDYLAALQEFQSRVLSIVLEQAITTTLEWLWDAIAEPVLDALGHHDTPTGDQHWPRLWWCPTGPLTVLPLHAAGRHDQPGRSVLDRVVSSYTPTLRALSAARTRPRPAQPGRLLLIALPNTPGQQPLPAAIREQALLTGLFDDTQRTVLADTNATRANILDNLATHTWTHASCHGDQNLEDPTAGGLLPHDWYTAGLVSILDLTTADHAGGEFVFLPACKTATGGVTNLDEAINFTAALQYAGWRHVIGTLWSVWDTAAADVAHGTYHRLVRNGKLDPTHTAEALNHALRDYRERDSHRHNPSRWAFFLHAGP